MADDNVVRADLQKLAEMIRSVRVAFMQTFRASGAGMKAPADAAAIHARPMYTQKIDPERFDGELFFFSDVETDKVHELQDNAAILLTYAAPDKEHYVVVRGVATCERNEAKAEELWNIHAKGWWPEGPASKRLAVIRVRITDAEYWDGPGKVMYVMRLLSAVATGTRIETYGEHGKL